MGSLAWLSADWFLNMVAILGTYLHNPWLALHLCHPPSLFPRGLATFVPSLALLSEQLLGRPLRGRDPSAPTSTSKQQQQPHDSREDASVALALVKQELQRGGPSPLLDPPELQASWPLGTAFIYFVLPSGHLCNL